MRSEVTSTELLRRMEAAWTLLKDEQVKIATIASTLGYSSHAQFSTAFKLYYKVSPARIRASFISKEVYERMTGVLVKKELKRLRTVWELPG